MLTLDLTPQARGCSRAVMPTPGSTSRQSGSLGCLGRVGRVDRARVHGPGPTLMKRRRLRSTRSVPGPSPPTRYQTSQRPR